MTLPRGVFARALVPRAALRPQQPKKLEGSRARRRRARPLVPLGAVAPRPPHHLEVARLGAPRIASSKMSPECGAPRSSNHTNASRWPFSAAVSHMPGTHRAPRARSHSSVAQSPLSAAWSHTRTRKTRAPVVWPTSEPRGARSSRLSRRSRACRARPTWDPRSREPSVTPAGVLPRRLRRTSPRPTGSRSRAATEAPRGGLPSPPSRTPTRPTDIWSRAPTSASRDTRPPPRPRTWTRPTVRRGGGATSARRGALRAPPHRTRGVMKRAPLSSSHRIVSSWPPFAAATHTSSQNDVLKYPRRCRLRSVLRHPRSAACSGLSSCELPDSPTRHASSR